MFSIKPIALAGLMIALFAAPCLAAEGFPKEWLQGVREEALQKGISQKTVSGALSDVEYIPRIIELDRKQPENTQSFAQYRKNIVSPDRIQRGREQMRAVRRQLDAAAGQYGVPAPILAALWGIETNYGKNSGGYNTVSALATLAYDGRRSDYFRGELLNAMRIIDERDIVPDDMTGSWAGAMGQNQFMPSSFLKFAVDGDNDGKRDIWDNPADIFASSANYLAVNGWRSGEPWGMEVALAQPIPESLAGPDNRRPLEAWTRMGVRGADGGPLRGEPNMQAALVLPDGEGGSAFLTFDNYKVIKKWNRSTYFATSVGLLADALSTRDRELN